MVIRERWRFLYLSGLFGTKVSRQSHVLQIWLSSLLRLSSITRIAILQDRHEEFNIWFNG